MRSYACPLKRANLSRSTSLSPFRRFPECTSPDQGNNSVSSLDAARTLCSCLLVLGDRKALHLVIQALFHLPSLVLPFLAWNWRTLFYFGGEILFRKRGMFLQIFSLSVLTNIFLFLTPCHHHYHHHDVH